MAIIKTVIAAVNSSPSLSIANKYGWEKYMANIKTATTIFFHFHFLKKKYWWEYDISIIKSVIAALVNSLPSLSIANKYWREKYKDNIKTATTIFIHFHFLKKTNIDKSMIYHVWLLSKQLLQHKLFSFTFTFWSKQTLMGVWYVYYQNCYCSPC